MHNLLLFLLRYSTWILFIIYVAISGVLLFGGNLYQRYVYLSSANAVSSTVYSGVNSVTSYFNLRDINEDLQHRNSDLEMEVLRLKEIISLYEDQALSDSLSRDSLANEYRFYIAHVINNSLNRPNNFITIDRGRVDGITKEMGVVDQNGIVGAVDLVGEHASRVISLLNPDLKVSVKVHNYVGQLQWDGKDYREAIVLELPEHAVFHTGDTVVTSGFSNYFPADVPVGIILREDKGQKAFQVRIRLFTDFSTLSTVRVIGDRRKEEIRALEEERQ